MLQSPRRDNLSTIQIGFTPHCLTTPQTTILCEVQSGSPVILYRWTKNGVALSETNDRLIVNETGSYQCTARNHYGNDTASTQVTGSANAVSVFQCFYLYLLWDQWSQ